MNVGFAALSVGMLMGVGAAFAATPAAAPGGAASSEGMTILQNSCVTCHDIGQITDARHNEADWDATLKRMVDQGAVLSPAQYAKLKAFLVATYPDKAK